MRVVGTWTRRQPSGAGIDAQHPAERTQHPPQLRRGGDERDRFRVGEQIFQKAAVSRHLVTVVTGQPQQPGELVRQLMRRGGEAGPEPLGGPRQGARAAHRSGPRRVPARTRSMIPRTRRGAAQPSADQADKPSLNPPAIAQRGNDLEQPFGDEGDAVGRGEGGGVGHGPSNNTFCASNSRLMMNRQLIAGLLALSSGAHLSG